MSKMTDLEICKRIAEIEGLNFEVHDEHVIKIEDGNITMYKLYHKLDTHVKRLYRLSNIYNPLKDKLLLLDLIFKHEAEIGFDTEGIGMKNHDKTKWIGADFDGKENLPRAILELIIEAHKC